EDGGTVDGGNSGQGGSDVVDECVGPCPRGIERISDQIADTAVDIPISHDRAGPGLGESEDTIGTGATDTGRGQTVDDEIFGLNANDILAERDCNLGEAADCRAGGRREHSYGGLVRVLDKYGDGCDLAGGCAGVVGDNE